MRLIFLLFAVMLSTGCIMIDSRVSRVKPSAVRLTDFEGTFGNLADYRSESVTGLYNVEYLQEYLGVHSARRAIDVQFKVTGELISASVRQEDGTTEERTIIVGRNCRFEEGFLVFPSKADGSLGGDSPTLGFVGAGGSKWTLDEAGNLVVVVHNASAGTVGIIPVGMAVRWMAAFPRVKE